MTVPASRVLDLMLSQTGDPYVLGAEADPRDPNPAAFDCSEIVEWACARAGVVPKVPDGAWWQFEHCRKHGTLIPIGSAIVTPGALLFRVIGPHGGGGAGNHVAVSLGNGRTIEARGRAWGVGSFNANGRGWTHGALIPGVAHNPLAPAPEPPPAPRPRRRHRMDMIRCNIPGNPSHGAIYLLVGGRRVPMKTAEQANDIRWLVGRTGGEFVEVESPRAWLHFIATFPEA